MMEMNNGARCHAPTGSVKVFHILMDCTDLRTADDLL